MDPNTKLVSGSGSGQGDEWRVIRTSDNVVMDNGSGNSASFSYTGDFETEYQLQFRYSGGDWSAVGCKFHFGVVEEEPEHPWVIGGERVEPGRTKPKDPVISGFAQSYNWKVAVEDVQLIITVLPWMVNVRDVRIWRVWDGKEIDWHFENRPEWGPEFQLVIVTDPVELSPHQVPKDTIQYELRFDLPDYMPPGTYYHRTDAQWHDQTLEGAPLRINTWGSVLRVDSWHDGKLPSAEEAMAMLNGSFSEDGSTFIVGFGDVLWKLARAVSIDLQLLLSHNGINNPKEVRVGTEIQIPNLEIQDKWALSWSRLSPDPDWMP